MTELLDVFEDAGVDRATVSFLVEALQNAEQPDWGPILEPFLPPERALDVLSACPRVLERTVAVLEAEAEAAAAEAAKPPPNAESHFLDSFVLGAAGQESEAESHAPSHAMPGVLAWACGRCLGLCARLCRRARALAELEQVWAPRTARVCRVWGLALPKGGSWREHYFTALRPRSDVIYVGECRYVHYIRPGASMETKLINKSYHWVDYRRYVRLLPPDAHDGALFALVLRDACPFTAGADALLGVNPRTHVNSYQDDALASEHRGKHMQAQATHAQLRGRVAVGTYTFEGSCVQIRFSTQGDHYCLTLDLSHGAWSFCGRLEWREYAMVSRQGERVPFDLGRSKYGGGDPADHEKDHFPAMEIRNCRQLEHFA